MIDYYDSFRAMNTDVDVIVHAEHEPVNAFLSLRLLFERQEEKFSRFRPTSLLSQLNAGATVEDESLARVIRLALDAYELTLGVFNPMILPALTQAGYATTFEDVQGGAPSLQTVPDPREAIELRGDSVRLRDGALDLGGIVKGWAVDVGIELLEGEWPNLFVNAGGDLRCAGAEEGVDGWFVAVDGAPETPPPWEGVIQGAVATSTTRKRRWTTDTGQTAHHLIDPRTGMPATSPLEQVTVWAEETWLAECVAKAVLIGGSEVALAAGVEVDRILGIHADGTLKWW